MTTYKSVQLIGQSKQTEYAMKLTFGLLSTVLANPTAMLCEVKAHQSRSKGDIDIQYS